MAAAKVHTSRSAASCRPRLRQFHGQGHDDVSGACGRLALKQRRHDRTANSADIMLAIAVAIVCAGGTAGRTRAGCFGVGRRTCMLPRGSLPARRFNRPERNGCGAGVEIRLDPGWKTYWRYPGDSGVPPALDFAGSGERQIGDGAVAGAEALRRRRRRTIDRLCAATSCCRCGSCRRIQTDRRPARQGRLCRLRQSVRSGAGQSRAGAVRQGRAPKKARSIAAEARVPRPCRWGPKPADLVCPRRASRNHGGQDASSS